MSKKAREFYKSIRGSEGINAVIRKGDPDDCQFDTIQLFWFAESYHQSRLKEVTDERILKGAIQQDSMKEQIAWGDGAKWILNLLKSAQ